MLFDRLRFTVFAGVLTCSVAHNAIAVTETKIAAGYKFTIAVGADGKASAWGIDALGTLAQGRTLGALAPQAVPSFKLAPSTGRTRVALNNYHVVSIRSDGTVWTWGANDSGQLGDGTRIDRTTPVQVPGLGGVIEVGAGARQSYALKSDGTVWAWGSNAAGTLGDGTLIDRLTPVRVAGLDGVVSIAAYDSTAWAVRSDGTVWTLGQTGASMKAGISNVVAVAPSSDHVLALLSDGTVWAWGSNLSGDLGDGTTTARDAPAPVPGLVGIKAVSSAQSQSMALGADGRVWIWGRDPGTGAAQTTAVVVPSLDGVARIAAGFLQAMVVKRDGTVWAWGLNQNGALGDVPIVSRHELIPVPERVPGLSDIVDVTGDSLTTIAVRPDGSLVVWGQNAHGAFGDGRSTYRLSPVAIPGLPAVKSVAAGGSHGLAVATDGTAWTWGLDLTGALPDEAFNFLSSPVQIKGLTDVAMVASGFDYSYALKSNGSVWSWGVGADTRHLGRGTSTIPANVPGPVDNVANIVSIATGGGGFGSPASSLAAGLALTADGRVWAWGNNGVGQLGDGTTTARPSPFVVPGINDVAQIAMGAGMSIAVRKDGTVWTWGSNTAGQLGDGSTANRSVPMQVPGIGGIVAVATEGFHVLALASDGTVWAWGLNANGQLGDGTTTNRSTPVRVQSLTGVVAISAGRDHSVAATADGSIYAWGNNDTGQIGDGTLAARTSPVRVFDADGKPTDYVVERYNVLLDHFFITADFNEAAAIDNGAGGPGWTWTNQSFKAGGLTPVCRFYGSQSPGPNSHLYTLAGSECDGLRQLQAMTAPTEKRWNFESLDFSSTRVPATGSCPAGTVPVYRAYNNGFARGIDSNHRITTSQAGIADVVARGWIAEGAVMCAPN